MFMTRPILATLTALSTLLHAEPSPGTAASARIWLQVPPDSKPLSVTTSSGAVSRGEWLGTPAEKERLSDINVPVSTDTWTEATLSFTPESDTTVTLSLLGPWNQKEAREEVLYDNLHTTGATIANPDFEEISGETFTSWKSNPIPLGTWPIAGETAPSGKRLAAAWNNRTLSQDFQVKGGTPVTITLSAKAASPPGYEKIHPLGQDTPAHAAAKKIKRGVNFGNRWEVPPPFSWQIPYSLEDVDLAAAEGFDHIRIPIAWHHYLSRENGLIAISPKLTDEIDPIIDRALEKGLHVIIDWHHFDPLTTDPDAHQLRFVDGWKAIATRYADRPESLWFELINEPKDKLTTERLNLLQAHAIEAIRRIAPDRTLLVTTGEWGSIRELPKLRLPADDGNLIVTVHNYEPFNFTHQGASWTGMTALKHVRYPGPPETPLAVPDALKDRADIVSFINNYNTLPTEENPSSPAVITPLFDAAAKWSKQTGRPIHLGEFGVVTTADPEDRARYLRDMRTHAEKRGIPWTLWDWKAGFAYWDEKAKAPLLKEALFGE